jgi:O-antigen ligase
VPVLIGIGVTIAGLFGILEAATQTPIFELLHFTAVAKIDPALLEVLTHGSSEEGQNRIKSIFNHPIIFGQVMAMTSPLFLHLILHTRGNTRLLGISQAIVTVVSLVICDSRSPLIVFSVSIIFFFFLFNFDIRSRRRLFLFFIGLLVAAFAAPIAVDYTVGLTVGESDRDIRSGQVRVLQLQRGQDALSRSPITGYGSGSAIGYAGVRNNTTQVMTLDNYYLTLSVDSGYIGASIFIIMIFIFILFGGITTFNSELTEDRSALASFVALIAGFIPGMTIVSIPDALTYVYMAAGFFLAETGSRVVEARRAAFMSARGVHGTVLSPGLGKAS